MSTCHRLDLQTLKSQPCMPKNLPNHYLIYNPTTNEASIRATQKMEMSFESCMYREDDWDWLVVHHWPILCLNHRLGHFYRHFGIMANYRNMSTIIHMNNVLHGWGPIESLIFVRIRGTRYTCARHGWHIKLC